MTKTKNASPQNEQRQKMIEEVHVQETRAMQAHEKTDSIWFGLGTMGKIGWLIVVPMLLGILVGLWIDSALPGPFPWTLAFLLIGVLAGSWNAWRWLMQECDEIEREREEG